MPRLTLREIAERFQSMPDRIADAVKSALPACRVLAVSGVRRDASAGRGPDGNSLQPLAFPRPAGGDKPLQSTGAMVAGVSCTSTDDELILRANHPGARLHQFGGIVTPKQAKALSIPLTREAQRVGGARNFPRNLIYLPMRGANPDSRGKLAEVLYKGRGKKQKPTLIVHYLLRARSVIPARKWLGFSAETVNAIYGVVNDRVQKVWNRFGG